MINRTRATRSLVLAGAFALPLGAASAIRVVDASFLPATAFAEEWEDLELEPATAPKPTERQLAAAIFARDAAGRPVVRVPLYYPMVASVSGTVAPADGASAPERAPPSILVNSVMQARGVSYATVNGKLRKVGDDIGDGWIIRAIDVPSRAVTLSGPGGRTLVRSVGQR